MLIIGLCLSTKAIAEPYKYLHYKDNDNVVHECTTKTSKSKVYDKELKEYIINEYVDEICIGRYVPPERPILNAIKHKIN